MTTAPTEEEQCRAFEEKVSRIVYLDNLSTEATTPVINTALGQFGAVTNVNFISSYSHTTNIPLCALVEMENANQVDAIVSKVTKYPLMICGMPRPVRAHKAQVNMFDDCPRKLGGQNIEIRWVQPNDPDFQVAKQMKALAHKNMAENAQLLKLQLEKEEDPAEQQGKVLKVIYKKYKMLDNLYGDKSIYKLSGHFGMDINYD